MLNRIELIQEVVDGFWEVRGYDRDAWVGNRTAVPDPRRPKNDPDEISKLSASKGRVPSE